MVVAASSLEVGPANAVTRAIGGAEEECRANGNCLELGEWDGAIGWSWGGKDRCDATDPRCGADGKLLNEIPPGAAVPAVTNKITQIVELTFAVGRAEEGTLRIGLYGEDAPESVQQFITFVTRGLRTTSDLAFENGMGVQSIPVAFSRGGILGQIVPGQRLDFGIPSQAAAYSRSKGLSKAGEDFLPQPRPKKLNPPPVLRAHDVAGLLSVGANGIGYGGTGFEQDDECFESSFQLTAAPISSMDQRENRRVIGQLMDADSMAFLARLATLPTKKGFKGVIPGQNSGPPLLKTVVAGIDVTENAPSTSTSS